MWGANKHFLDPEIEQWHLACWDWMLRHLGGLEGLRQRPLVLPTAKFFPKIEAQGHARAEAVLTRVKTIMGMQDWPCLLTPQRNTSARLGEFHSLQSHKGVGGSFGFINHEAAISYDPQIIAEPLAIISTFAHELSHYRMHNILEKPPGAEVEPMLNELATEMVTAFHGFALIAANAAFNFAQHGDFGRQGWQSRRLGYFSDDSWVFALAVFLQLRDETVDAAKPHLKPHLAQKLVKAQKRLSAEPALLEPLRAA
jgi:hypothetical protein